ncbi:MAG: hypothetical protein E7620_05600 [Ruminococcaceae bacterium]|nr:hypothetical protein [Oscillospiraceae bacterium]
MKNKKFGRTDWFLLLVLLLSAAGILLRGVEPRRGEPLEAYAVVGVWREVDPRTAGCLSVGQLLYTEAGEIFGEVLDIKPEEREAGEADVVITARVMGRLQERVLLRNGTRGLCLGETYLLFSDTARVAFFVTDYGKEEPEKH